MTWDQVVVDAVAVQVRDRIEALLSESSGPSDSWGDVVADIAGPLAVELLARIDAEIDELATDIASEVALDLARGVFRLSRPA